MNDIIRLALFGFFGLILLSYVIGSIIMIYHLFAFGLNRQTATASTLVYLVSSGMVFGLIAYNLITISANLTPTI